jgi:hypothetical protein
LRFRRSHGDAYGSRSEGADGGALRYNRNLNFDPWNTAATREWQKRLNRYRLGEVNAFSSWTIGSQIVAKKLFSSRVANGLISAGVNPAARVAILDRFWQGHERRVN